MLTDKKSTVLVIVVGVAVYYCEWAELIVPGFCNQGLGYMLTRIYGVPLLLAGVIGYFGYRKLMFYWLIFMIPSWTVRFIQLLKTGGNLLPPLIAIDLIHLILTGLIIGSVGLYRKRYRPI